LTEIKMMKKNEKDEKKVKKIVEEEGQKNIKKS
jgi:hypothetical protein